MSYTVVWKPVAEEELARLWTHAEDRGAITAAADEIDRLPRSNPHDQGEARRGSVRVVFVDPPGAVLRCSGRRSTRFCAAGLACSLKTRQSTRQGVPAADDPASVIVAVNDAMGERRNGNTASFRWRRGLWKASLG
jgi:plasmid stabilization system protein ParE